jgi:gluconokinase
MRCELRVFYELMLHDAFAVMQPKKILTMPQYFIAIDLGTTNLKAIVTNEYGNILQKQTLPCATLHPKPNDAEQNTNDIFLKTIQLLQQIAQTLPEKPIAISFSAAMHSLLAMDKHGETLTNAIIWADNRAEKQANFLKNSELGKNIFLQTGTPIHTMSPLSKLLWLREVQPTIFEQTDWFCSIKEYIFYRLFGQKIVDMSIASATGLLDFEEKKWFQPALMAANITENQLSRIVSPYHREILGKNEWLPAWEGVPFVVGASDGALANLGSGAVADHITTLTIGTSGAVRRTTTLPVRDEKMQLFNYILDENHYIVGGPTNNGGIALEWFAKNLAQKDIATLMRRAQKIPIGSDGLVFLPFILGERAPLWDAQARGAFLNIAFAHTQAHFTRATLEGILFNLQNIHTLVEAQLSPTKAIYADGGFTKSPFWVQMMADITGKPIFVRESEDSAAIGAIMLAMKAMGLYKNLEDAIHILQPTILFTPNLANHAKYERVRRK